MNTSSSWAALGAALATLVACASGQSSCPTTLTPTKSVKPTVASGYRMALVATGLTKPRSIQFDTAGNLLVVQSGSGIVNLALQDNGGTCLTVKNEKTVISASAVRVTPDCHPPLCYCCLPSAAPASRQVIADSDYIA